MYLFFSFLACMPRNSCINQANGVWRGGLRLDSTRVQLCLEPMALVCVTGRRGRGMPRPGTTPRGWRGPRKDRRVNGAARGLRGHCRFRPLVCRLM
jgi:hypothetical protein